jgi:hypothetical protein
MRLMVRVVPATPSAWISLLVGDKMKFVGSQAGKTKPGSSSLDAPQAKITSRASSWVWAAALLVLVLLVNNHQLLRGKVAPQWDAVNFFGPAFSLVSDHIRAHHLLLWDPWTSGGTPDFAEPELGASSPILLMTAAIFKHPRTGFVTYWMVIWIGAGLGMLMLTRHLKCPPWGGLIASLGFVTSGFFLGHAQHISSLYSVAFLPWICWRLDDALLTKRYWSAVQAGVLYGLSALGGYPQFTILTSGFLALWVLGRLLFSDTSDTISLDKSRRIPGRILPALISLALVGVVGVLILCPSYLAFMTETHGYSDRVGERTRVESTSSNLLPAGAITTLASPYLSMLAFPGLPARLWPTSDISMSSIYSGAVVTVLGLLALLGGSRWRWWMALLAVLFLCASLGSQMPLRGWIYDLVPPTRYFRNPSMFSSYSIFLLCILSALAARDLAKNDEVKTNEGRNFLALSILAATASVVAFVVICRQVPNPPFDFGVAIIQLAATWYGLLLSAFLLAWRLITVRRCAQILVALAALDASMTIMVSQPVMYTSATIGEWRMMGHEHNSDLDLTSHGLYRQLHVPRELASADYPNNRNIAVKVPVLNSYTPFLNRFELSLEADPDLPQFALGNNRSWFVEEAVAAAPTDTVFRYFTAALRKGQNPIVVVHTPDQMNALSVKRSASTKSSDEVKQTAINWDQVAPALPAAIDLISYRPNSLEFRYDSPKTGWLMVTDRWAPGWKAEVNGKPVEVYGGDFLFRAIRVDAGMNMVKFWYEPRTWFVSVIVSWGTLLVFAIVTFVRFLQGRKQAIS